MKEIKKYLKIKGITLKKLSEGTGIGIHSLNKIINQAPYKTKQGIRFRETRYIREAIAKFLGLPYELVWGPHAPLFLEKLIQVELFKKLEGEKQEAVARILEAPCSKSCGDNNHTRSLSP